VAIEATSSDTKKKDHGRSARAIAGDAIIRESTAAPQANMSRVIVALQQNL
jgi:hypothetical protein